VDTTDQLGITDHLVITPSLFLCVQRLPAQPKFAIALAHKQPVALALNIPTATGKKHCRLFTAPAQPTQGDLGIELRMGRNVRLDAIHTVSDKLFTDLAACTVPFQRQGNAEAAAAPPRTERDVDAGIVGPSWKAIQAQAYEPGTIKPSCTRSGGGQAVLIPGNAPGESVVEQSGRVQQDQ
jgi:hypothetical protein